MVKILKDTFRPEIAHIKRELEVLRSLSVHVGIMGDTGSDLLIIAGVHEYGATIRAKNVKNLSIPLDDEAKGRSPKEFNDLEWIPGHDPGVSFLARPKKKPAKNKKSQGINPSEEYSPDDYTWLYMLVKSVEIPERSFIRSSYDSSLKTLEDFCKEASDGIIRKGWTAQQAADHVGKGAMEMTREYFNTKIKPDKSELTQRTTTSRQTLYDTGRLYHSITYRVEGGTV